MDKIAVLPIEDREYLFTETANRIGGMISLITEKDFWVVWSMKHIFSLSEISDNLIFRGGTSLSKAHSMIERFSEDVDLGINYKFFGYEGGDDPLHAPSNSQRKKILKKLRREVRHYLTGEFKRRLTENFTDVLGKENWSLECKRDGRIIQFYFYYPHSLPEGYYQSSYIPPTVKIEIDPRASTQPQMSKEISPFIADYFPDQFDEKNCFIITLNAERTFWEKVALLHRIFIGREKLPERFSRHCYDVVQLARQEKIKNSCKNGELFFKVIKHNKKFYEQTDANYLGAIDGDLKLIPGEKLISELKYDYLEMKDIIFGEYPEFDVLIHELKELENKINKAVRMK